LQIVEKSGSLLQHDAQRILGVENIETKAIKFIALSEIVCVLHSSSFLDSGKLDEPRTKQYKNASVSIK